MVCRPAYFQTGGAGAGAPWPIQLHGTISSACRDFLVAGGSLCVVRLPSWSQYGCDAAGARWKGDANPSFGKSWYGLRDYRSYLSMWCLCGSYAVGRRAPAARGECSIEITGAVCVQT